MQIFCSLPLIIASGAVMQLAWAPPSGDRAVEQVARGDKFSATVIGVSDGDTLSVLYKGKTRKVRLSGVDAPEKSQDFGQSAKQFTAGLAFRKQVTVEAMGKDRYGRIIAEVSLEDGRNLSDLLLASGYAWWYREYSRDRSRALLEEQARESHLGLWAQNQAIAPWAFRKALRK